MQFWVYILRCSDGSSYTGHTEDLQKRVWEHQGGRPCPLQQAPGKTG